jgi:transposase
MPSKFEPRRVVVKYLMEHGATSTHDICIITSIPKRTVNQYKKKLRETGRIDDSPRSGRPRKNTAHLRRQLAQIKRSHERAAAHTYASLLRNEKGVSVGRETVRQALHDMNYHWRLPGRKKLTTSQKLQRIDFAREYLGYDFSSTWSFDQVYFNLQRHSNKCWVSAATEESLQQPKLTNAQDKISVGACFAISRGRKSALCFLPKKWNATDLVTVFEGTLLPSIQWPKRPSVQQRFIMDNDGRHQIQMWKSFAARKRLQPFSPWPSNSPDFNPIENLFAWMKRFVENRLPTNENTLRAAVEEAFDNIPDEHTFNLMNSMRSRLTQAVAHKGARTKY